ncbi:hypothetical protein TNCV_1266381 [Trichonephila clavipes]|nr:hypothetical protein TNCV_1266381 [Trichonephila clavipes]
MRKCTLRNGPIVSSEEFVAVDDDNVRIALIVADKDISKSVQNLKNIIDAYFNDENEINIAAPVPTHPK